MFHSHYPPRPVPCSIENKTISNGTYLAMRPMGTMPFDIALVSMFLPKYHPSSCEKIETEYLQTNFWKYKFAMYKFLRLNLTLSKVYFSSEIIQYQSGTFNSPCNWNFVEVQSTFITRTKSIKYCGIHSHISSFPQSNVVFVFVRIKPLTSVKINLSYNVIDCGRLESDLKWIQSTTKSSPLWSIHLVPCNTLVEIFHVKVKHFERLFLTLKSAGNLVIHDGPGEKSEPKFMNGIENVTQRILLSTFQGVAHYSSHVGLEQHGPLCCNSSHIMFSGIEANISSIMQFKKRILNFNFPQSHLCSDTTMCVMQLHTNPGKSFNITLSSLSFDSETNSLHCSYAGVALYQVENNSLTHVNTECVIKHIGKQYTRSHYTTRISKYQRCQNYLKFLRFYKKIKRRRAQHYLDFQYTLFEYISPSDSESLTFFTATNSAFLILYSYVEYGAFSVNLTISDTTCKIVMMSSCKKFKHIARRDNWATFWKKHCTVLQLRRSYWSRKQEKIVCSEQIGTSDEAPKNATSIAVTGMGRITGNTQLLVTHRHCHSCLSCSFVVTLLCIGASALCYQGSWDILLQEANVNP